MAEQHFKHYGAWTVFLGRFVWGLRFMAGPMAGALGMSFSRFFRYNFAGAVVYCSVIVSLAYFSAPFFDRVVHLVAIANWALVVLVLLVTLSVVGWRMWRMQIPHGKS